MRVQATTLPIPVSKSGICIVRGWDVKVRRERGHLIVSDVQDGIRRESRFARATSGLRRLIVIGNSGYFSLDGLTWLADWASVSSGLDSMGACSRPRAATRSTTRACVAGKRSLGVRPSD